MSIAYEVNFDGLVGPTHNYAGLSYGNVASQRHGGAASNPKAAALEGLAKMKRLMELGLKQAVLPPAARPNVGFLRSLGFTGSDAQVLERAWKEDRVLAAACWSASSMWAANAATVSPGADARDGRVHITAANLLSNVHRAMEAQETAALLSTIFPDESGFSHHGPVTGGATFSDEGAANHTRLCSEYGEVGLEVFVYGRDALRSGDGAPMRYPARQTRQASQAVARLHGLDMDSTMFVQQNPQVIDAGVFHNDVIAVGNQNLLLCHERAFVDQRAVLDELRRRFEAVCGDELIVIEVSEKDVSLKDAVESYLFNSQLVTLAPGRMALVCPMHCRAFASVERAIQAVVRDENPIAEAEFVEVRQSMCNGGGPACLRLRVVLNEAELASTHGGVMLTAELYENLVAWVERHYRDELKPEDLADGKLMDECREALDALSGLLKLPGIYGFQR